MSKCTKCDDTGVIETGNNNLACDCQVGETALFNVTGIDSPTEEEYMFHLVNAYISENTIPISDTPEIEKIG